MLEEDKLNLYLMSQKIELKEWRDSYRKSDIPKNYRQTAAEDSIFHDVSKTKNPYEILGFGFVSLF